MGYMKNLAIDLEDEDNFDYDELSYALFSLAWTAERLQLTAGLEPAARAALATLAAEAERLGAMAYEGKLQVTS